MDLLKTLETESCDQNLIVTLDGAFLLKMICLVDIALSIFSVTDLKRLLPPLSVTARSYQRYSQKKNAERWLIFPLLT